MKSKQWAAYPQAGIYDEMIDSRGHARVASCSHRGSATPEKMDPGRLREFIDSLQMKLGDLHQALAEAYFPPHERLQLQNQTG